MEFIHLWDKNGKNFKFSLSFTLNITEFTSNNWGRVAFKSSLICFSSDDSGLVNCYLHLFF